MADCRGRPVPKGWNAVNKSNHSYYLCPATGQQFYTYEDMMRYVTYAKFEQFSRYASDFEAKIKGKSRKKQMGRRGSKSAMKRKKTAAPPKKQAQPGLVPMKPSSTGKEDQAGENSWDSDSDPDDLPYEEMGKRSSKSATTQSYPAAPPKKLAQPALLPVKPNFSAADDDMSLGLIQRTNKEDQAGENSSDSGLNSNPDDPPYVEMGKSSKSAMEQKHPTAPPKQRARPSLFLVKSNFSAEDDDMRPGMIGLTDKEVQAIGKSSDSDSDSDSDDPPYEEMGKQSSKSAMKWRHPIAPPKKRARPGLLPPKPNFSVEDDVTDLGFAWITDEEDLAGENGSDSNSDSDPNDPRYEKLVELSSKSATQQKHPVAPPRERAQSSLLPVKPNISDQYMGLGLKGMSNKEDQAGENGLDSDPDSDPEDPPYDPRTEADRSSQIRSKPDSPKIILYQRRSKLKK